MLLDRLASPRVKELLSTMLRVTMMRGAQSAGLITYQGSGSNVHGVRRRVVNGKRTDLCDLLMKKFKPQLNPAAIKSPALFQGHTRFATSSIANMSGCHPHQWTGPRKVAVWRRNEEGHYFSSTLSHECFITHNGDLDFFEWHGTVYPLDNVFTLLEVFLGCKRPAPVDSAGVAGLLDLLRAKGMWFAAVRYGYVFGGLATAGNLIAALPQLWSAATMARITAVFERTWQSVVASKAAMDDDELRKTMLERMLAELHANGARPPPPPLARDHPPPPACTATSPVCASTTTTAIHVNVYVHIHVPPPSCSCRWTGARRARPEPARADVQERRPACGAGRRRGQGAD